MQTNQVRLGLSYWVHNMVDKWAKGKITGRDLTCTICPAIEQLCDLGRAREQQAVLQKAKTKPKGEA